MKPHIASVIMVKNESVRLSVTLNSLIGVVDSLVVYDTGSTDDTIDILKTFSNESGIPLRLLEGTFVDFAISRNEMLDFVDTFDDIDYIILMDCNDEIRDPLSLLRKALETNTEISVFRMRQELYCHGNRTSWFNKKVVKPRLGFRYVGVVHECLDTKDAVNENLPSDIVLFQDKINDDAKGAARWRRDKDILLSEYKKNPLDSRTVFYLAQTYGCIGDNVNSLKYYTIRSKMEGFEEERFISYMRCGWFSESLIEDWDISMGWYMKAFAHRNRVEPLISMAKYYIKQSKYRCAFLFVNMACDLKQPDDGALFVDQHQYDYARWHLLGIIAYYAGFNERGKLGCQNAIATGYDVNTDTKNLVFYK